MVNIMKRLGRIETLSTKLNRAISELLAWMKKSFAKSPELAPPSIINRSERRRRYNNYRKLATARSKYKYPSLLRSERRLIAQQAAHRYFRSLANA